MQNDTVLEKFKKFRTMIVSSNIPNGMLMDMIENYITTDEEDPIIEVIPVIDGQLSFFEPEEN